MIDRRMLIVGGGLALGASRSWAAPSPSPVPLWPAMPPGGGGPRGPLAINGAGAVANVAVPTIERFAPVRANGGSVLIAAGGGYKREEIAKEAHPAAHWLAARGYTAWVLTYRLPIEGWSAGPLAQLQDAQRAIRLVRAEATRARLDSDRVAVLGFSAGAHLMGLAATRSAFASYAARDDVDRLSARPKAAALIYPVITLEPPLDHTSTKRSLVGDHPTASASAEWSVETHVRGGCPPVFLVQADDDPVSDPRNSAIMADACRRAGVPVERHRLSSGGHGFSMGRPETPSAAWPRWFEDWLIRTGMRG